MIHVCKFCKAFFLNARNTTLPSNLFGMFTNPINSDSFLNGTVRKSNVRLSRPGKMYIGYFLIFTFHVSSTPSLFGMFTNSINIGSS